MKQLIWILQITKTEREQMAELMHLLEQADVAYDIVYPLEGQILNADTTPYLFNHDFQYFVCGSYPLSRYVYKAKPEAVFSLEQYNFDKLWTIFGKDNFVNSDAQICAAKNIVWLHEEMFVRPLEDTKSFNGGIYNFNTLTYDGMVVVASLKHISKEYRFYVVDGKIVTGSLYKNNGIGQTSSVIDSQAIDFAQKMVEKFTTAVYPYSFVVNPM